MAPQTGEITMHRHIVASVAAVAALLLLSATPVRAISYGELDSVHLNVGALGIQIAPDVRFFPCSGTLIAPDVFLVAAHCVASLSSFLEPEQFVVTFDDNRYTASTFVPAAEVYFDPAYLDRSSADSHDLAVVILSQPVTEWGGTKVDPAQLPPAALLDELAARGGLRDVSFVNVGYGWSRTFGAGKPGLVIDGYRRYSTSPFQALNPSTLKLLMNHDATGEGGICNVDSGGPKFLPGTDIIVAVTRAGDAMCRAMSEAYRLDTPQAREFLGQFVTLP
jgi:hypothetical protein